MDVLVWLRGLGLERYETAFRGNDIDERILPNLTQEDLKEIGVGSAKGGEGQVVLLSGEPCIGKSRLTAAYLPFGTENRYLELGLPRTYRARSKASFAKKKTKVVS
jgi:hypothetical protein